MTFTSPPEIMTAVTDLFDAIAAIVFLIILSRDNSARAKLWKAMMLSLAVSGAMGLFVHSIEWNESVENAVWILLPLPMCIAVSAFFARAITELNTRYLKKSVIFASVLCALSYASMLALYFSGAEFLVVFTLYAAVCVLAAGVIFIIAFFKTKQNALWFYIIGVFIEIPGGIVQAKRDLYFTFIVKMDFNSLFHLILLASIIFFTVGYVVQKKSAVELKQKSNVAKTV